MRSALAGIDLQWCRVVRGTLVRGGADRNCLGIAPCGRGRLGSEKNYKGNCHGKAKALYTKQQNVHS